MIYYNSFDELVEKECLWTGSKWRGRIYKDDLIEYCNELGIEVSEKENKESIYKKLKEKTTNYKIYLRFRDRALGVPSHWYEEKFEITKFQRKKMIDSEFIKAKYSVNTKIFTGTYADVLYVDSHQFFHMTQEKIDSWREENIRGFKKN